MKLLRYGSVGQERPGILSEDGEVRDLSGIIPGLAGEALLPESIEKLRKVEVSRLPIVRGPVRMGPCVGGVGKFVCIGLNYSDHAKESGMALPVEPIVFMKATSSICGPDDDVVIPRGSTKTDWEVELGVVIGKPARRVSRAQALDYVAGYVVVNDITSRERVNRKDMKEMGMDWVASKCSPGFLPMGPWLVSADEIKDPHALDIRLSIGGEVLQHSNTRELIFPIPDLVAYLSSVVTLEPGDVVATGTPGGVGFARKPPRSPWDPRSWRWI